MTFSDFYSSKLKGAIFDADGTLLDSSYVWDDVANNYLVSLGITPPEDYRAALKPMSPQQSAKYTKNRFNLNKSTEEIMDEVNSLIEASYFKDVELKPGVSQFLQKLYTLGVKMCIATATDKYLIQGSLERLGILKYFSEIFTCRDVGAAKDRPKIYETALLHLGTEKNNTAVFEDALHALTTAKNAGFITVAIKDNGEAEQEKLKRISDYYITSYKEHTKIN